MILEFMYIYIMNMVSESEYFGDMCSSQVDNSLFGIVNNEKNKENVIRTK